MEMKISQLCRLIECLFLFLFLFFLCTLSAHATGYYGVANAVANIRKGPGTGYSSLGQTSLGSTYELVSKDLTSNEQGCNTGWYFINYNGKQGYVCGEYLDIYERGNNTDQGVAKTDCEKELAKKGFPSSYWSSLCQLKSQYPKWNFEPQLTKVDFNAAVSAESGCGTNLMNTSVSYYINTSCGQTNYNGYRTITSGVVAYYLDPRNFLNTTNIFMFESQHYNKNISDENYLNAIVAIFGSTNFILNQIPDLPLYILNASKELEINPISIASRVKQELGNGKLVSGKYAGQLQSALSGNYFDRYGLYNGKNFNNYYNFYNIGAFDSCSGITECALTYAYNNGWGGPNYNQSQARQIAMTGGSKFIKNRYISGGQNSAYLHKFNVNPVDASRRYLNQYMSNILAPQSESALICSAYKSLNIVNSSFTFYIPVFENMPNITKLPTSEKDKEYNSQSTPVVPEVPEPSESEEDKMTVNQVLAAAGFKRSGNFILGVMNTNVNDFISKLESFEAKVEVKNASGKVVTSGILGTGFQVSIQASTKENFLVVIYGDTSGDGKINALDLLRVQKHILNTSGLSGAQKEAADPSRDGKINALDLLKIQKYILGTGSIEQ